MRKLITQLPGELQVLENRMLMASDPLSVTLSKGALAITGSKNDDSIVVTYSAGSYVITNGSWSVTKTGTATTLTVNGKAGNDTVTIDPSVTLPATLIGDLGDDHLIASSGATSLSGGAGNDTLEGGTGNDTLQGGAGNDNLSGGDGVDWLDYSDHSAALGVTLVLGQDGNATATNETDTFTGDIENARGGAGADNITADESGSSIYGNAGNDTLTGLGGNDAIYGGVGNDFIDGADGNDTIYGDVGNDTESGGAGSDKLYGDNGNDLLNGGDSGDSLYGGVGNDSLNGDNGDDLLVSIGGGTLDSNTGGNGEDSFWIDSNLTEIVSDADATETANGDIHQVASFANKASKELTGQAIADPTIKGASVKYRNFKTNPIFSSSGPGLDDIKQGQLGDCYFLAQIGSFAKLDADVIEKSIVDFGDGTYGVQFVKNGSRVFYRLDADLPSYSASTLAYAAFGAENSIWVGLLEKAWAYFRQSKNTYASIEGGFMIEVSRAFGKSNDWGWTSGDPNTVLSLLKSDYDAGKSITAATGTSPAGSLLVGGHAYTLNSITSDGNGGYTVVLRNPWGVDGTAGGDGMEDGYITMTGTQFLAWTVAYAVCDA